MFYEEMKKQRESLGITLEQVSNKTKINKKFLFALEEGNFSILPYTYIRLFLRAYAQEIEMDPDEIIKSLEEHLLGKDKEEILEAPQILESPYKLKQNEAKKPPQKKANITTVAIFFLVFIFIIAILKQIYNEDEQDIARIPIGSPEITLNNTESDSTISAREASIISGSETLTSASMLSLQMHTRDSCWIRIIRDNKQPLDTIFAPGGNIMWMASQKFILSLGRPSTVTLSLNGKNLGPLGINGVPTRLVITKDGITRRLRL